MSDNKREQERTELYRTIWALANELRGSVDGWDFKQYVLGMLFYRYIYLKTLQLISIKANGMQEILILIMRKSVMKKL